MGRRGAGLGAWIGLALAFGALGCHGAAGGAVDPAAPDPAPIVSGTVDPGDGAVIALVVEQPDHSAYLCSGALIGPSTFLTAAHCVKEITPHSQALVVLDTDVAQGIEAGHTVAVDGVAAHPGYDPTSKGDWNDVGIVHLAHPVDGPLMPFNRYPLDRLGLRGQPVRIVGYGVTHPDAGDEGMRRSVVKTDVSVASPGELNVGPADGLTCSGDSGGPLLFTTPDGNEAMIGLVSRGDDQCAQLGVATRVDAYLPFVRDFLTETGDAPSCEADGRCGFDCKTPDPDCPCAPDNLCTSACSQPATDPDCPQSCLYGGKSCSPQSGQTTAGKSGRSLGGCSSGGGAAVPLVLVAGLLLWRRRSFCGA